MLRRDRQMRMQIHQLVDACIIAASFWLGYEFRASDTYLELLAAPPIDSFEKFFWFYLVLIPVSPLVLESQGFYDRPMIASRRSTLWSLFKGCLFTSLGLTLALFFSKLYIARSVPVWFGLTAFLLVFTKEEIIRLVMKSQVGRSQYSRRFLLVGARGETDKMRAEINSHTGDGIHVVSELNLDETHLSQVIDVLHDHAINGVILSTRHSHFDRAEAVLQACEIEGVEVWMMAEFFKTQVSKTSLDDFHGRPVLVFRSAPEASWQGILKQAIDFVGAWIALILLALPMAVIAILIRITSPGPVFFKQLRSGLNGSPFTVYKFRTMVTNAEQIKHELASMNEMSGPVFKMTSDPRITPLGKWLRKFSIDELPQFFNVLRGEMSLVGPRPLPVDETRRIHDMAHRRRLSVRPGITCLWQVSGRSEIKEFKDWVRMDLEYIDNWSLWLDLKILVRTIPAVFCGSGAK